MLNEKKIRDDIRKLSRREQKCLTWKIREEIRRIEDNRQKSKREKCA